MAPPMKLELAKFDITKITDDSVVVMIGKRKTGKSFLVKDMLYYHTDIPIGTVISGTERANHFYHDFVPKVFIHDEVTPELIGDISKRQFKVTDIYNKEAKTYGSSRIDRRAFLILDDCLYDTSWSKDRNMRSFFMNGRHLKLFFILTMQYALGIPPSLRTNIDYVFILRENIARNRRIIWENYASIFPTFDIFNQVMDQCTNNFECIVIDNNNNSNKLDDCVFWYKAEDHQDYKMCASKFWEGNDIINDEESEEEDFNMDEFTYKKGSRRIDVRKFGGSNS